MSLLVAQTVESLGKCVLSALIAFSVSLYLDTLPLNILIQKIVLLRVLKLHAAWAADLVVRVNRAVECEIITSRFCGPQSNLWSSAIVLLSPTAILLYLSIN